MIQAVREFSKADARRFRLRDSLRAQEIARQAARFTSVYVEAGTIHFFRSGSFTACCQSDSGAARVSGPSGFIRRPATVRIFTVQFTVRETS
ncbi:MAG: hypothetical protein R2875_14365 [Desulfobacterales bacterium]